MMVLVSSLLNIKYLVTNMPPKKKAKKNSMEQNEIPVIANQNTDLYTD